MTEEDNFIKGSMVIKDLGTVSYKIVGSSGLEFKVKNNIITELTWVRKIEFDKEIEMNGEKHKMGKIWETRNYED